MIAGGASSLRSRPPAETLALATRLMRSLGISRVTDITRMDRLGVPVCASIRPRGLALCVNAGKGMNPLDARVGALMEAIEFAVAEPARSDWRSRWCRLADLEASWEGELDLARLAPRIGLDPPPDHPVEAIRCEDLTGGSDVWLPAELIFMPYGDDPSRLVFGWSSNGLASGNSIEEATLHALLEVLERDALAMNTVRDDSQWLPPFELPKPFRSSAEEWRRMGIQLSVRLVPSAVGLPCFRALLHDAGVDAIGLAEGSGLHFDRDIALARAICEAAQSRLSHIHGGRDDIAPFFAARVGAGSLEESLAYREAFDTTRQVAWDDVPSSSDRPREIDALVRRLVERVRAAGFAQVLRHCFAVELGGLHVVRVVVPGCESIDRKLDRAGPRLVERFRSARGG